MSNKMCRTCGSCICKEGSWCCLLHKYNEGAMLRGRNKSDMCTGMVLMYYLLAVFSVMMNFYADVLLWYVKYTMWVWEAALLLFYSDVINAIGLYCLVCWISSSRLQVDSICKMYSTHLSSIIMLFVEDGGLLFWVVLLVNVQVCAAIYSDEDVFNLHWR